MKLKKYLVSFRHDGEVFNEIYFSNPYTATKFIEELFLSNDFNKDMDEIMIQIQEIEIHYGEV